MIRRGRTAVEKVQDDQDKRKLKAARKVEQLRERVRESNRQRMSAMLPTGIETR